MADTILLTLKTKANSRKIHVTISGVKKEDVDFIKTRLFSPTNQETDRETDREFSLVQKGKSFRGVTYLTKQKLNEFTESLTEKNIPFKIM